MQKIYLLLLNTFFVLSLFGQIPGNLVPNYSFDKQLKKKIKEPGSIELLESWVPLTEHKADVYSKEGKREEIMAPMNMYGREVPEHGTNYVGVNFYSQRDREPRTYIGTELKEPLKEGQVYCIGFMVSMADLAKYAVNNIGAALTKGKPSEQDILTYKIKPQVMHSRNRVFEEQYMWEKICVTFQAEGGENWISIGNFFETDNTEDKKLRRPSGFSKPQKTNGYYYVEDVYVTPIDSVKQCVCEKDDTPKMEIVYQKNVSTDSDIESVDKLEHEMVFFDFGKSEVSKKEQETLEEVLQIMDDNPTVKIEIHGHSELQEAAKDEYADVSNNRATEVQQFLLDNEISADRIVVVDKKAEAPKTKDESVAGRSQNRRVEFKIIKE